MSYIIDLTDTIVEVAETGEEIKEFADLEPGQRIMIWEPGLTENSSTAIKGPEGNNYHIIIAINKENEQWKATLIEPADTEHIEYEMRYKKIGIGGKIVISLEELNRQGRWNEFSIKADDNPSPEFKKALDAFTPIFNDLCEFDPASETIIDSINFSYVGEHETLNISISGAKKLINRSGYLSVTTPKLIEQTTSKTTNKNITADLTQLLNELRHQADKFRAGRRQQTEMRL